ncbi:4-hydroxybutyrate CoA-transferase [Flavobacteriaceae bacterium Ap0902]|nr:4-hydroxybutyrate CoA-transferase [Flavobacteriaceae bacterium Ap0902]
MQYTTQQEAISHIQSGERVFIHTGAMTPEPLINELAHQYKRLKDVEITGILPSGNALFAQEPYHNSFYINSFFVSENIRKAINQSHGSYTPTFLSEIPTLYRKKIVPIDVALIQVSPPDKHGYCSLGVSIDISLSAVESAKKIIALVNPNVPRSHGDGIIHKSRITAAVAHEGPIFNMEAAAPTEIETKIGENIASLIDDGATLQMGIGAVPEVVLSNLKNHKKLGIHTELFSDGVLPLVESGAITGEMKKIKPGKILTCFALGSQKLYDFIDDNPLVHFKESSFTNDTSNIRQNPNVIAINSAIEIDLTGQVCADTLGSYQYSGVGGQMDFVRGASLSEGGKPIFGISSRTIKGKSKLVAQLALGASVTTTRAHVHYIATEYGVVDLFGKNIQERAKLLISIAHPDDREMLSKQARELLHIHV